MCLLDLCIRFLVQMECSLIRSSGRQSIHPFQVLILVLMEDTLGGGNMRKNVPVTDLS